MNALLVNRFFPTEETGAWTRGETGRATLGGVVDLSPPLGSCLQGGSWDDYSRRE